MSGLATSSSDLPAASTPMNHSATPAPIIDPTRKQVARDRVTWTVRAYRDGPAAPVKGRAEAEFRAGRITALRLGG